MIIFEQKWTNHYSNCNDYEKYVVRIIGELLQSLRRENNHRLDDLANRIGVSARAIEENELGRRRFHWYAAFRVLRFYKKTLEIKLVDAVYKEETAVTQEN